MCCGGMSGKSVYVVAKAQNNFDVCRVKGLSPFQIKPTWLRRENLGVTDLKFEVPVDAWDRPT